MFTRGSKLIISGTVVFALSTSLAYSMSDEEALACLKDSSKRCSLMDVVQSPMFIKDYEARKQDAQRRAKLQFEYQERLRKEKMQHELEMKRLETQPRCFTRTFIIDGKQGIERICPD